MLCQLGYNTGEQIECCASLGIMQENRLSVVWQFGYNAGEQIECCASLGIMQENRLSVVPVWV